MFAINQDGTITSLGEARELTANAGYNGIDFADARKTNAVDDAGVIEAVGKHDVGRLQQRT
jgi:hypothetical protein